MAQGIFNLKQVNQAIRQGAWSAFNPPQWVEYLCVAGGGSGGGAILNSTGSGGGGGGGLLTGNVTVEAGASYTVTVGAGGTGSSTVQGTSGTNSVFGSITSTGGGAGGNQRPSGTTEVTGLSGGSGGGGSSTSALNPGPGGSGISGQGNFGGTGTYTASAYGGGGGGGAGTVGLNGTSTFGGNGGAGIASAISGIVTTYAGGGGAGTYSSGTLGIGGVGGGGNAARGGTSIGGITNTGGGGGGNGGTPTPTAGGSGGSGIVIVRYPGNVVFYTGGTVNYNNGYISHIFNATGTLAPATPAAYNTSYQISRSLRFNSADSAYLNRTFSSASNQKTWTWSGWVKRTGPGTPSNAIIHLFGVAVGQSDATYFAIGALDNVISIQGWNTAYLRTTAVYRDYSAWYHVVVALDTTQATAANRLKLYVNGVQETAFSYNTPPNQNADLPVNGNVAHLMFTDGSYYLGGYLTEVNFIDGQQLTPSSFGATSTTTGVWAPIKYTGTYGTNGFYLNFSDNSNNTAATLGKDYSGNGNNWTPNNFSVTAGVGNDSMVDVPTLYGFDTGVGGSVRGNYCTLNPLIYRYGHPTITTFSNGNLDALMTSAAQGSYIFGSIFVSSGKWYWETTVNAIGNVGGGTGIDDGNKAYDLATGSYYYYSNGSKGHASLIAYGASYTTNDIIGTAFDADVGTLTFYKNGVSQGVAFTGLTGQNCYLGIGENGFSMSANFGQRPFAYTAPSGFKALCTQNLPTPAIGGSSETLASKFFNAVTYSGNGAQSITGVGFTPDLVWVKSRSGAYNHQLHDAVRGATAGALYSNSNDAQNVLYQFDSFDSDGFTTDASNITGINNSGQTFVAWNWRAGNNAGSTNNNGTIASQVSVNQRSGFSIVKYTGQSAAGTVGHGLGIAPSMILVKVTNTADYGWVIWHSSFSNAEYILFDTDAKGTAVNYWNSTNPPSNSTTFGVGSSPKYNNATGDTFVAYCFAPIAGYSAFGSYTGNGSADGTFIYTGFRPAFIMIKRTDTGSSDWQIIDTARDVTNVAGYLLQPNATNAESNATPVLDFLSNGFKNRNTYNVTNVASATYIYMAFASSPFKYSLAR